MMAKLVLLFYKRLVQTGGAEVLLAQHYKFLRERDYSVKVVCFEHRSFEQEKIAQDDLILVRGILGLAGVISSFKPDLVFCHSGYIDLGIAAHLVGSEYSIFLHQPTTMSFNEPDKLASRYFNRYRAFARHDDMYRQICDQRKRMHLRRRCYIELRTIVSQFVLKKAKKLFVLSDYAVREKEAIFGLDADILCGALDENQLSAIPAAQKKEMNDTLNLVTLSRLDINKRIHVLIEAVGLLRQRGVRVNLKIGGTGPAEGSLRSLVSLRELEANVDFLGYVNEKDIRTLYQQMDLFATIDWADYRLTTYEVLSHARKVLVSDDTEADERLIDAGYLYVSAPEAEALADTIQVAAKCDVTWPLKQLESYLQEFSWNNYFERIQQLASYD